MENRYRIAFTEKTIDNYSKDKKSKIIIEDNDSFVKYIHVNYIKSQYTKNHHEVVINGSERISTKDNLKFYNIPKEDIDDFRKLAESNPENFEFGVKILMGRVGYKPKSSDTQETL